MSKKKLRPGPGQEALFGEPVPIEPPKPELEPPATSLADYYLTLGPVLRAISMARSKEKGYSRLGDNSAPVKEYAARMEEDRDEARRVVVASSSKNRNKAQVLLNKRNRTEYALVAGYAEISGEYDLEFVFEHLGMPPSIDDVEYHYYEDPEFTPADQEKRRSHVYAEAKHYEEQAQAQVA